MARIRMKYRESLRKIERRARETADPVERLRYVRHQMDSREPLEGFRWWPGSGIAAAVAVAIVAALLALRIR